MVVSRDRKVADAIRSPRDHGWIVGSSPKAFDRVGYNSRLTEIQSVIGLGELERFDRWNLPRRRRLADYLLKLMAGHPLVRFPPVDTKVRKASFWLVPFVLDVKKLKCSVAQFIETVQKDGVGVYKIMWPLMAKKPVAMGLIGNTIGFWVHPTYAKGDIAAAVKAFRKVADAMMK